VLVGRLVADHITPRVGIGGLYPRRTTSETQPAGRYGALVRAAVTIVPVDGLPEIEAGADLAALVGGAIELVDGDIVLITSKIVSKAEGRSVELDDVEPSPFAERWARQWDKDPRVVEIVLRESRRVVRQIGPVLITETHHGFVCANSGVDQSSSGAHGRVLTLPVDPDASARRARVRFAELGVDVAVVVTDTFGRPWREGQTDIAIGIAGMQPLHSYIGEIDPHGHEFRVQEICVADELAAAGELVKGNTSRIPVAVVRGYPWTRDDAATMAPVIRDTSRDLFR
jgi:coenzyme F420-0:L-glutamate ligase / coenzyme F420-1:gamma-L-glutamate ligase